MKISNILKVWLCGDPMENVNNFRLLDFCPLDELANTYLGKSIANYLLDGSKYGSSVDNNMITDADKVPHVIVNHYYKLCIPV